MPRFQPFAMRTIVAWGIFATAACESPPVPTTSDKTISNDPIAYSCDDLVLIGRAAHQKFTPISDGSILGHGSIDFDVNIRRVIHGQEFRGTIPARVIAHTTAREDVDFLFVLKAGADDRYEMIVGQVLGPGVPKYRLADHCSPSEISASQHK